MTHATTVSIPADSIDPAPAGADAPPLARPISAPVEAPPDFPAVAVRPAPLDPMLLAGVSGGACALDFCLFGVYTTGYYWVIKVLFRPVLAEQGDADHRMMTVAVTLGGGALSMLLVGLLTRMRGLGAASIGLARRSLPIHVLLGLAATLGTFAVFYLGVLGLALFWPDGFMELKSNPGRIAETLPRLSILGFAGLSLAVAFYEETVFRGFLFTRLRRLTGSWAAAAVLGSVIFTVPHLAMQAGPTAIPLFGIALYWCVMTWWRRSLVPAIIGHFLFNFIQLAGMALQDPNWK